MKNKNILVFGGSRGIGRVFAQKRVNNGDNVYVFSRSWKKQEEFEPIFISTNFCEINNVKKQLLKVLPDLKKIDALVFTQRYRGNEDDWKSEMASSVDLFKEVMELCYPYLKKNASVVAISSNAAKSVAIEQPVSYHAAKAALEQMIRYFAVKFSDKKIRVNGVSPAITLKPENIKFYNEEKNLKKMFSQAIPLGRMCESKDVCNVIDFLLSKQSSFITGQTLVVDGGLSLMTPEVLLRNKN